MAVTRFLGVGLAWREERDDLPASETGVAVLDPVGRILDAGWTAACRTAPRPGRPPTSRHDHRAGRPEQRGTGVQEESSMPL